MAQFEVTQLQYKTVAGAEPWKVQEIPSLSNKIDVLFNGFGSDLQTKEATFGLVLYNVDSNLRITIECRTTREKNLLTTIREATGKDIRIYAQ